MKISKPFEGLKIIELASVLAGPAAGMFFAELGATVIKVENPLTGGDVNGNGNQPEKTKIKKLLLIILPSIGEKKFYSLTYQLIWEMKN